MAFVVYFRGFFRMNKLLAAMFVALLMVGCGGDTKKPAGDSPESNASLVETPPAKTAEVGGIDLDDKETQDKIIAEAIDYDKIQKRDKGGERLGYAPNEQTPYTGWAKGMHDNGQIKGLAQFKDGKPDGLETLWDENGQKEVEGHWKDGKEDGLATGWSENGQKIGEGNHKEGKKDGVHTKWWSDGQKRVQEKFVLGTKEGVSTAWHPNGEKMSEYLFQDGKIVDGVYTVRDEDGTKYKITYKDGGRVSQELITTPSP
jgi:antitoxin component YwqK of YwqJK toxin-antitoxin module